MNYESIIYKYKVYGLDIESNIEIEEFIKVNEIDEKSKVVIKKSVIPERIKQKISTGKNSSFSREEIWFNVKNVAIYQIRNGNTIKFEPYENAEENLLKVYLMCSCLGFIMLQREKLAIHGGTVVSKNKAFIITGQRGAGKSTLTTAFRKRGYSFISDDVSAISDGDDDNEIKVNYGFPYQKLCIDSMDKFDYDREKSKSFMCGKHIKYIVPAQKNFTQRDIPLDSIFELSIGGDKDVVIEEVKGTEKLKSILNSIYREEYLYALGGISQAYVKKCLSIAKNTRYYKIIRPKDRFTLNEQIKLIEKIIL